MSIPVAQSGESSSYVAPDESMLAACSGTLPRWPPRSATPAAIAEPTWLPSSGIRTPGPSPAVGEPRSTSARGREPRRKERAMQNLWGRLCNAAALLLVTALAAVAILTSAVDASAQAADPSSVVQRFVAARNAGDVAGAMALVADDIRFVGGPVCTPEQPCAGREVAQRDAVEQFISTYHARLTVIGAPQVTGNLVQARTAVDRRPEPAGRGRPVRPRPHGGGARRQDRALGEPPGPERPADRDVPGVPAGPTRPAARAPGHRRRWGGRVGTECRTGGRRPARAWPGHPAVDSGRAVDRWRSSSGRVWGSGSVAPRGRPTSPTTRPRPTKPITRRGR